VARYLLLRLVTLVCVVFVITVFCFLLIHLMPGDPATAILQTSATPQARHALDAYLGLNRPLPLQYWTWLVNVLHGDLGTSQYSGLSVKSIIASSYRVDIELVLYSQVIAFLVSVPLAIYAARRDGGKLDQSATTITFAFYCLPAFILILWLVQLLTLTWPILPGVGSDPFPTGLPLWDAVLTNLRVMLLPSAVLAIGSIAVYYRLLRNELVVTLREEFIIVARSKGLTTNRILWRHALRPSSVTLLTSMGNNIALLIVGLFVIEDKMGFNGLGTQLVNALPNKDYLTILGITLVTAVTVVVVNFVIDLITMFVDPRIARA